MIDYICNDWGSAVAGTESCSKAFNATDTDLDAVQAQGAAWGRDKRAFNMGEVWVEVYCASAAGGRWVCVDPLRGSVDRWASMLALVKLPCDVSFAWTFLVAGITIQACRSSHVCFCPKRSIDAQQNCACHAGAVMVKTDDLTTGLTRDLHACAGLRMWSLQLPAWVPWLT